MWSDTEDDLHSVARAIGLSRAWSQYVTSGLHYDLTPNKRILACRHGAVEVTRAGLVEHMQRRQGTLAITEGAGER
jgi:hypothetical protein